ncbi:tRNA pseudouridine(55) synthase TruB [Nocardioides sp.]|uniref:tRNA pseudouridine(55) synthase TruB n=1 Tax=Nocardioides sp. TaxID=35761 RepID=UPI003515B805
MTEPRPPRVPAPSGLVVVDKPAGLTSHDVVARVRRALGTRKVGHAGTLDPLATGVLVVGVERATRLLGHLMLTEKAYDATARFGVATTTDDAEGEVLTTADAAALASVTPERIRAALEDHRGDLDQVPTAVSAIKVDGKRAYQRVRDGEQVELAARRVTVHELEVTDVRGLEADFSLRCSSGTYVRAIARDAGASLGVGGHLTALRRTAVGPYDLGLARTVEEVAQDPRGSVLPIAEAARRAFTSHDLTPAQAADVRVGRRLDDLALSGLTALFDPDGEFLALYEPRGEAGARPVAVFV